MIQPLSETPVQEALTESVKVLVVEFERDVSMDDSSAPLARLMAKLTGFRQGAVELCALELVQRQWPNAALILLDAVEAQFGKTSSVDYHRAGALRALGRLEESDAMIKRAIASDPSDVKSAIFLACNYRDRGQLRAAALVLRDYCLGAIAQKETRNLLSALNFLSESVELDIAAELCEAAIRSGLDDPELIAESGKLALQLGEFDLARSRYKQVLEKMERPHEFFAAQAIAQTKKFADTDDPDVALIFSSLDAKDLSPAARASAFFGVAKVNDDLGNCRSAAAALNEANRIIRGERGWDHVEWKTHIDRALIPELPANEDYGQYDFVPVFIVGMPRSGTTLTAELLQKRPDICSRGELSFMRQMDSYALSATTEFRKDVVRHCAQMYATQLLRDDERVGFYIDKNPMNFLLLDLIYAAFPNAKVICCSRNKGDIALSLWFQLFASHLTDFCYSFETIKQVMDGYDQVMQFWKSRRSIHEVSYERLVMEPIVETAKMLEFIGATADNGHGRELVQKRSAILTASIWQARQPVYTHSVEKYKKYMEWIPELKMFE